MGKSGTTLFLLTDEAQKTRSRRPAPETPTIPPGVSEVIAGTLRVRMNSVVGAVDQIRARRGSVALAKAFEKDPPNLENWFDALSDHPVEIDRPKFGFVDHLRQYVFSILMIFAAVGFFLLVAGICSFYFGVMLPFSLA